MEVGLKDENDLSFRYNNILLQFNIYLDKQQLPDSEKLITKRKHISPSPCSVWQHSSVFIGLLHRF